MRDAYPLARLNRLLRAPEPPFTHGMHAADGPSERERWLEILKSVQKVQKFAAGSQMRNGGNLLADIRESIIDAVRFVVDGEEVVDDGDTTKQIRVWSSPQNARLAILQEAIALAHSRRDVPLTHHSRPPLVILISERHEDGNEAASEALRRNFLDSWSSTCYGVGEVLTIQGDTSQKIRDALQTLFDGFSPSEFFPVLMVVHASPDSNITSNLTTLKRLGDPWNVRFCVEGPALAMLAQPNRPSDPEECAAAADVMLLNPAAWFGFRMCALLTYHRLLKSPVLREFRDHYSRLMGSSRVMKDYDETHGLATGPMLNLWTVLSKIGFTNIRNSADAVTVLAESLAGALRDSPNIVTTYEGIGCVVRISYALSREDRLLPKEKSKEHVSLVNNVIFASLVEESEALSIHLGVSSDGSFLQFSPVRLLSAGTFWIPPIDMLTDYANRIQETADKYESCRAGSVAFRSCVAKCREIQFVQTSEEQLELHLSFAAFRIVPTEMADTWHVDQSSGEIVEGLTALVARELTESPHDVSSPQYVVQEDTEQARALAEQFNRNPGRLRSNFLYTALSRRRSFPHGYDGSGPLPFEVFLHSDSENNFYEFISVEPRGECKPVHAVNQATVAADLMIACVVRVMESWRAGEIALPLEIESVRGSDTEKTDYDANHGFVVDNMEGEHGSGIPSRLDGQSFDHLNLNDPHEAVGSEVSRPTLGSRIEQSIGRSQKFLSETDQSNYEGNHSSSTKNFEYDVTPNSEALLHTSAASSGNVEETRHYKIKDIPSTSTIERSSKGTRTDEEAIVSDCVPPISARAMNTRVSEVVPKTSDLVAAMDAIPVTQAANRGRWFGSWRTKRSSNQNEGSHGESGSSSSGEESSGSSNGQMDGQDSSEDNDDDVEQESDSSSSEEDRDDRNSSDDSSETSNNESANETDDSKETSSTESSDATNEDVDVIRRERKYEEPSPAQSGRTSRLLSWIRPSTVKPHLTKTKQKANVRQVHESDSGSSTSASLSALDQGKTRNVYDSSVEEEYSSSGRRTSTYSSDQQAPSSLSEESERESSSEEERCHDEASEEDSATKATEMSWTNPRNRGYGFRWFGRTGESCKPDTSRTTRRISENETDIAFSSDDDDDDESESFENSDDKNRRKSSRRTTNRPESYTEDESSESTCVSEESDRNSSVYDTSDSFDSRDRNARHGTGRRESAETDESRSASEEEGNKKSNSGSFFDWMLPSWATTPPKFREPKGPVRDVSSRLGIPVSSDSSTDSESEKLYERQRHVRKMKKRTSSGGANWSLSTSGGSRNRRKAR